MKLEIAKQWAEELTSGRWKQCRKHLASGDGHCCLGVLCEMAHQSGVVPRHQTHSGLVFFGEADTALPWQVVEWAEMKSDVGYVNNGFDSLADLNDDGKSFGEIAPTILANSETL